MLIPPRDRGFEYLDDPQLPAATAERSLKDIALSNKLFGGTRAVMSEMQYVLRHAHQQNVGQLSVLDVGTGLADIPVAIAKLGTRYGIAISTTGLEATLGLARVARKRMTTCVAGDGRMLPFGDHSVDVVTCSQVLHHFGDAEAQLLLRECARVARRAVVIAEIRRSWLAMALLWLVSFPLRFHPISRHDGVASIRRGFTGHELAETLSRAGAMAVHVRNRFGWRVTARWQPGTTQP